ncbi:PAS domain-containing sensor histidine kinase [Halarcobacter bivalviorum]|uniref:histidine kinase n=2 Tax=Halarcobacter bivalviorum TaxID=663364 RepID=A0AB33GGJ4_9BACT|nr:PAS domain-containing sensor histidine kinase [Halarcobacter bivalviorum]AXH11151.1 PAS sensor-containing two-component system histidine kinase [Halarcobacter bivalviorum]
MENKTLYLKILNNLPEIIVLIVNENIIKNSYGKISSSINNTQLSEHFSKVTYSKLMLLKLKKIDSLIICWNKKDYEVSCIDEIYYFKDISKYRNMHLQLKKSLSDLRSKKEELRAVFDLAGNGISILNEEGMFIYANKFFQTMMEYTMEELYKESCISLSSPEYAEPSRTAVQKAIEEGIVERFRKICVTKSGKQINASMSLSYIKSTNEIVMITSDITEDIKYQDDLKRRINQEVKKRTKQYEIMCHQSRLASMGEMIEAIAHQWRQPLNSLSIIIQGLRHLSNSESFDFKLLNEIENEMINKINFMSETIDDFSNFFRTSKEKRYFNLLDSIKDTIRLVDIQLKNENIKLTINIEDGVNLEFFGLENEFRQALLNIIDNSLDVLVSKKQHNSFINIDITQNENFIELNISDNAGGISSKNLQKIFKPYFTTKKEGNGIGLYMSKMIIEQNMKGNLSVRNSQNGAVFTISLKSKEMK